MKMKFFDSNTASIVYSYLFIFIALLAGAGYVVKHFISSHTEELSEQLNKIMYALYNDGKTGLINKVDDLLEHQQSIKIDVEVLKARMEDNLK